MNIETNNLFTKILQIFTPLIDFIKSKNGKYFLIIYLVLIIISVYILNKYKQQQLINNNNKHIIKNSNREKAIESFNNYNKQIAEKLSKQCSLALEDTNKYIDEEKKTLPNKDGLFYFANLEILIKEYVIKNILDDIKTKKELLDTFYLSLDSNLDNFVNQEFTKISSIINEYLQLKYETQNELKYTIQEKIKTQFNNIKSKINLDIINDMDIQLRRIMSFDETRGITINETPIPKNIKDEIYERLYFTTYNYILDNNLFPDLCNIKQELNIINNDLESAYRRSYDTMEDKRLIISSLNNKLKNKQPQFSKIQNKYTLYLLCLEEFSTSLNTKKLMKEELKKMSISQIQPANELIIDNINNIKHNIYGKISSIPKVLNIDAEQTIDLNERDADNTIANQFSTITNNYEKELINRKGDTRIDPISIFSNVENSAIKFLEGIRGGNSNNENKFTNRFIKDNSVRGSYLNNDDLDIQDKQKSKYFTLNNITLNNNSNNQYSSNDSIIEGFNNLQNNSNIQNNNILDNTINNKNNNNTINDKNNNNTTNKNITNNNINNDNDLLKSVGTQFLGISESIMNNPIIQNIIKVLMNVLRLDNIKSSEQLGLLLIIISILLFFIDLSS